MERNDDFSGQNAGLGGASGSESTGAGSSGYSAGSAGGSNLGGTGGAGGGYGASGAGGVGGAGGIGGSGDAGGYGASGGAGYGGAGSTGTIGGTGTDFGQGTAGTGQDAQSKFQQAKGAAADKLGVVKEKVSNLNTTLADKLEAGAEKLRQRGSTGGTQQFAGATATESVAASNERMVQYQNQLAKGLDSTADFLRNGDLKASVEEQVRTKPGRTLLIALGVGYVLGKAFRR